MVCLKRGRQRSMMKCSSSLEEEERRSRGQTQASSRQMKSNAAAAAAAENMCARSNSLQLSTQLLAAPLVHNVRVFFGFGFLVGGIYFEIQRNTFVQGKNMVRTTKCCGESVWILNRKWKREKKKISVWALRFAAAAAADYVNKVGSGFDDDDDVDQKKKERYPLIYTTKSAGWLG